MTIVLAAAAIAVLWLMSGTWKPAPSAAVGGDDLAPAAQTTDWSAMSSPLAQGDDEGANADGDERLPVQLWTLVAAGGAAGVGLLLFLLRIAMGWVKPPPPQEESHH